MVKILRENNELKQMPLECIKGATLLSAEEAENLLSYGERRCEGTQEAINNGLRVGFNGNSDYWLRSAGCSSGDASYVDVLGEVNDDGWVDGIDIGMRPALILNLQASNFRFWDSFEFGGYMFTIISDDLALCNIIIDACPFNQGIKDGNNYKTSYIKSKVDNWFADVIKNTQYKEWNVETDDELFDVEGMTGW